MSYHDHMDIDKRERVRAAERADPGEILDRVTCCVWITAGSLSWPSSHEVARELMRRGWIAVDKIDPNFHESGSVRL